MEPVHDRIVWLWVYRDFERGEIDRASERVCLRLGMTAFPQHLLVDPRTLARLADTGRSEPTFLAAVAKAAPAVTAAPEKAEAVAAETRAAEGRAAALEQSESVEAAERALDDPDLAVRGRAAEVLARKAPAKLAARAAALLTVENDALRFEVLKALAAAGGPEAARPLDALLADPGDSLNPNMLRSHAVSAVARCGDAASLPVLRPFAASGNFFNGLTSRAVDAVAAIAAREEASRPAAVEILVAAYPPPAGAARAKRACAALAKRVHAALTKVTGRPVPFPAKYDAEARARVIKAWE